VRERRKYKRLPVHIALRITSLYKQDDVVIEDVNEDIEVHDISKSGIGFDSVHDLPLEFYFNAEIIIDREKHFFCVLRIIRKEHEEDRFQYGCEFIGLADVLSTVIDEYELESNYDLEDESDNA